MFMFILPSPVIPCLIPTADSVATSVLPILTPALDTSALTKENQQSMKTEFFSLVAHISMTLDQRMSMERDKHNGELTFQLFREYVAGLSCSDLQSKRTVGEIFGTIHDNKCWDLAGNPYSLLHSIVEWIGDKELLEEVEEARRQYYNQYLIASKVVDHISTREISASSQSVKYAPNFASLSIKLGGVNVNECSLAYLTDLWETVKECVTLPDLYSVLTSIEVGSLVVTWLVPSYAVPAVMRLASSAPDPLKKFSIVSMMMNGVCFYNVSHSILNLHPFLVFLLLSQFYSFPFYVVVNQLVPILLTCIPILPYSSLIPIPRSREKQKGSGISM